MLLILAALGVEWLSELCQVEVAGQDTLVLCSDRGSLEGWIGNSGGVFCKKAMERIYNKEHNQELLIVLMRVKGQKHLWHI